MNAIIAGSASGLLFSSLLITVGSFILFFLFRNGHPSVVSYFTDLTASRVILTIILGTSIGKDNYSEAALPYIGLKKVEKYLDSNQYELALIEINKVIEGEPGIGRAHYLRALILSNIGDTTSALEAIKTSLRMPLEQRERQEAIELLISIGENQ